MYVQIYGYTGGQAYIVLLYLEKGLVKGVCYDSGREVSMGEEAARRVGGLLGSPGQGLLEVWRAAEAPSRDMMLSRPRRLEDLASREARARPAGRDREVPLLLLEEMDGLRIGMLISEVILRSRLIATSRSVDDGIRRARSESRRDRSGLYRVAVQVEDGSLYNIFIKEGRIRRVLVLAPSGVEGRVLSRRENVREILSRLRVRHVSVYRVECPECERLILHAG